jgi:hypothetical protein
MQAPRGRGNIAYIGYTNVYRDGKLMMIITIVYFSP